jgi:hypothetical protein
VVAGETQIPIGSIGSNIKDKTDNACYNFEDDCHSCVVAGCVYDPNKVLFERCYGEPSSQNRVFPPTYKQLYKNGEICKDTLKICQTIEVGTNTTYRFQ